jgi:folate-binding protein YgfZ
MNTSHLEFLSLIRFAGPDAATFLQGQLSNDTRRLGCGQSLRAALSTPQGRVLAVLTLLPHSTGIIAILPREIVAPTIEGLRKYVLRSKVKIEDLSDEFVVLGHWGSTPAGDGYTELEGVGSAPVGGDTTRRWIIGSREQLGNPAAAGVQASRVPDEHDWRLADIRAGLPQIYGVTRDLFVAQMLNLDLLDGISFSKGCFTGQEIIARTQHLGRIKRRMFRLELPAGSGDVGGAVQLEDGRSGRLIEVVHKGEIHEALAVLRFEPSTADPGQVPTDSERFPIAAVTLPLPYTVPA